MTRTPHIVSQGYPLWAITDRAFDSCATFDSDDDDFAFYIQGGTPGGPFPVIAWEYQTDMVPRPILAGVGAASDVVIIEGSREEAVLAAVRAYRTQVRELRMAKEKRDA